MDSNTKSTATERVPDKPESARRTFRGVIVSQKMKDTAVVAVERYVKHPKYQKYLRRIKRYKVHDPGNTKTLGEKVVLRESRPMSKTKRFVIVEGA